MGGIWKAKWTGYINGLSHGGIRLNETQDTLLWMHNTKNGEVTARLAYDLIVSSDVALSKNKTQARIWKYEIPLKLKCFMWFVLENRISTCDILLRKGWVGPNKCCLCMNDEESIDHIFMFCSFVRNIIDLLYRKYGQGITWIHSSILKTLRYGINILG